MNRYIELSSNNKVISIRYGYSPTQGEIESVLGELGQIMQEDGSFVDPPIEPIEPKATIEEQILAENQYQTALLEMQMLGGM